MPCTYWHQGYPSWLISIPSVLLTKEEDTFGKRHVFWRMLRNFWTEGLDRGKIHYLGSSKFSQMAQGNAVSKQLET
jgi:hypothetical protein